MSTSARITTRKTRCQRRLATAGSGVRLNERPEVAQPILDGRNEFAAALADRKPHAPIFMARLPLLRGIIQQFAIECSAGIGERW